MEKPLLEHVTANYRYMAAYNELTARINQRQQTLSLYVALTVGLLAALIASKPGNGTAGSSVEWLILGFPLASACLTFLNLKSERSMTNLRNYLAELEQVGNAHLSLPSYNADARWSTEANKARRLHDLTSAVLVVAGNATAFGITIHLYPRRLQPDMFIISLTALVALACVIFLLLIPRWSYKPLGAKN